MLARLIIKQNTINTSTCRRHRLGDGGTVVPWSVLWDLTTIGAVSYPRLNWSVAAQEVELLLGAPVVRFPRLIMEEAGHTRTLPGARKMTPWEPRRSLQSLQSPSSPAQPRYLKKIKISVCVWKRNTYTEKKRSNSNAGSRVLLAPFSFIFPPSASREPRERVQ